MAFKFTILLLITMLYMFSVFVVKRYKCYEDNKLFFNYTKIAKIKEAIKEEALIQYQVAIVLAPIAVLIDLIILLLK